MQLQIIVNTGDKKDVAELQKLAAFLNGGAAAPVAATKPAKGKSKPVVEEDEDEEESEVEETEVEEDEPTFEDDDSEEESEEEESEDEEEDEAPAKGKAKPAAGKGPKLQDVINEFQATHKKLTKKLKTSEKAQQKLNALLKKHGAKNTRTLDVKKYATVIKELKAL